MRPELVYGIGACSRRLARASSSQLRSGRTPAAGGGAAGLDSVLAGVRLIRRTHVLLGAISLDLFAVLFGGAVALLPAFAKDVLGTGPTGLGVLRSAPAVGRPRSRTRADAASRAAPRGAACCSRSSRVFGAATVVFGLSRAMWLSVLALAVAGAADMVSVVLRQTHPPVRHARRAAWPSDRRGDGLHQRLERARGVRVGVAAALVGLVPAVVLGGVATIAIAALWPFLFRELARVDRVEELRPV